MEQFSSLNVSFSRVLSHSSGAFRITEISELSKVKRVGDYWRKQVSMTVSRHTTKHENQGGSGAEYSLLLLTKLG
jgi:hypothetical protein